MTNPYVPNFGAYSFMDVEAVLTGPNAAGLVLGGPQAASAEEGITITFGEESNTQTIGADGSVMNSLHASRAGTATFRLLKTSPLNKALMEVYNFQRQQSAQWGRNHITITDLSRGDLYTLDGCAFVRVPTNSYAKIGNTIEWEFHVSLIDPRLGALELLSSMNAGVYRRQMDVGGGWFPGEARRLGPGAGEVGTVPVIPRALIAP